MVDRPVSSWSVPDDIVFTPNISPMTRETVKLFWYVMSHSKEETLSQISRDMPIHLVIAYDMDGHILVMSGGTLRVDMMSWINLRDAHDVPTVRNMIYLAQQGGGYLYKYEFASVGEILAESLLLLICVMPIDDSWFITIRMPSKSGFLWWFRMLPLRSPLLPVIPLSMHGSLEKRLHLLISIAVPHSFLLSLPETLPILPLWTCGELFWQMHLFQNVSDRIFFVYGCQRCVNLPSVRVACSGRRKSDVLCHGNYGGSCSAKYSARVCGTGR